MKIGTPEQRSLLALAAATCTLSLAPGAYADDWKFGVGSGIRSLALDGDVGFATDNGGVIAEMDLDNGDTADMFESAFGFAAFAAKGPWKINFGYATLTLEDSNNAYDAEWDKAQGHFTVEYTLFQAENHRFGVLGGVQIIDHEWEIKEKATGNKAEPEDDWTDGVIGLTHAMMINKNWSWANSLEYSYGDSEGGYGLSTGINWKPGDNWVFNAGLSYEDIEYGSKGDISDNDFYYYDVEETTIGLGFMYTW